MNALHVLTRGFRWRYRRQGSHVCVRVFAGPKAEGQTMGFCGELRMTCDEWTVLEISLMFREDHELIEEGDEDDGREG